MPSSAAHTANSLLVLTITVILLSPVAPTDMSIPLADSVSVVAAIDQTGTLRQLRLASALLERDSGNPG